MSKILGQKMPKGYVPVPVYASVMRKDLLADDKFSCKKASYKSKKLQENLLLTGYQGQPFL